MRAIACSTIVILLTTSCVSSPIKTAPHKNPNEILSALIEDKTCDATFQCKVLGIGERPACGGPSAYLVYSNKNIDEEKVELMAEQVSEQERILNQQQATVDICKQVLPIQALCIANTCEPYTVK